ncbi:MAG: DegV family protein [Clostridia bacterium]|nr:DegV family protein [Clostridia bacterium]
MSIIFSDSGCDISEDIINKYNIKIIKIPICIDDEDYSKQDISLEEFYKKLRAGADIKTSSINPNIYMEYFEPYLKEGNDIIYVHFSSGVSGTFNFLKDAINTLKEKYPERKIDSIDTLNLTTGSGLLAYEVAKRNYEGMPHKELVVWANQNKNEYSVYFYVDSLKHLKKGGRISAATAVVGSMLQIKPLIHCADNGKLKILGKAIGRKKALAELVNYVKKYGKNILDHPMVIMHADDIVNAEELKKMLLEEISPNLKIRVQLVGTTIGTHCGPGTVAVVFHGKQLVA